MQHRRAVAVEHPLRVSGGARGVAKRRGGIFVELGPDKTRFVLGVDQFVAMCPDQASALALYEDALTPSRRDRMALMQAAREQHGGTFPVGAAAGGFNDRAVAGLANPGAVDIQVEPGTGSEVVARVFFRKGSKNAGLDMNRDTVWAVAEKLDMRPLGLVGINEMWSAFRLRRTG